MMTYSTEQMANELRAARKAKGLSQRALSDLVGVPQSHISKIEKGGVDLRLSSLVEIARALELEVTLVPRKNISAVRSITRARPSVTEAVEAGTRASKELQRLKNTVAKISHEYPAIKEIARLQRRINDLGRLQLPASVLGDLKKICDSLKSATTEADTLGTVSESLNRVQHLRNQVVHAYVESPATGKIRPAYSLDEDNHG